MGNLSSLHQSLSVEYEYGRVGGGVGVAVGVDVEGRGLVMGKILQ